MKPGRTIGGFRSLADSVQPAGQVAPAEVRRLSPLVTVQRPPVADDDPWLLALAYVARHYGRSYTAAELAAGGKAGGEALLLRAAERIGFVVAEERWAVDRLPNYALPALLPLTDGRVVVLLRRHGRRVEVYEARSGAASRHSVRLADLAVAAEERLLFLRPRHYLDQLEAEESGRHWFAGAFWRNGWVYGNAVLAALFVNLLALAVPLFVMTVYDRVVPNQAMETLSVLAIGVGGAALFDFLLRLLRSYLVDVAGRRLDFTLGRRLFQRVLGMRLGAYRGGAGSLAATLREFDFLRDFLGSATMTVLADLPFVLLFLAIIWLIGGPLVLVPLAALPAVAGIALLVQIPLARLVRQSLAENQARQTHLYEVLQGLETVKAVRAEAWAERRWSELLARSALSQGKTRFWTGLSATATQTAQILVTVGLIVVGVLRIGEEALTLGGLIACVLLANRVLAPLAQISGVLTRWQQARQALAALDAVMQLPLERAPAESRVHRPTLSGTVEFAEVSFSYPGADLRALDSVSFALAAGERVALVGRVGSGKTTLLKLAQGLHLPDSGLVRVDAIDLRQLEPSDLRRQVGYVPQQVALFRGTIRDNIALGAPEAGDEAILAAAELIGLGDLIRQAPRGLDQDVGEQGFALSGGQRQLIALARAIVQRPPILLLDEPTSGLDALAERAVIDALRGRLSQSTLLLATHRLPLFQLVDRLIVLDRGRVLADGPREEVLKRLGAGRLAAATA